MRLERLEINGFKSFSDRSELAFDKGVTAIVGPNGCGKSNVADAITWVMGEQSAKSLRGDEMEDVIFSGSDARKPTAAAEVRLRFSGVLKTRHRAGVSRRTRERSRRKRSQRQRAQGNGHNGNGNGNGHHARRSATARRWTLAPAQLSAEEIIQSVAREVEVTRRLYRSGESEYLIDGQVCRLRDVHDLLMDTGLGAKAYAIIEQGKIGLILSSRPTDRRQLIEEAAGVTKYKARRRSAELKLEAAQQNLTRIDDIVFEVEKQRGTLKRQAAKARRYQKLRDELRRWEKVLFARKYRQLAETIESARGRLGDAREREAVAAARVAEVESDLGRLRIELVEAESRATSHARERARARAGDQPPAAADRVRPRADSDARRRAATSWPRSSTRSTRGASRPARRSPPAARPRPTRSRTATAPSGAGGRVRGVRIGASRDRRARGGRRGGAQRGVFRHQFGDRAAPRARTRGGGPRPRRRDALEAGRRDRRRADRIGARRGGARRGGRAACAARTRPSRRRASRGRRANPSWPARASSTNGARDRCARASRSSPALEARLKSLEELEAARAGYGDAARTVLAQANGKVGQQGAVADYLEVEAGLRAGRRGLPRRSAPARRRRAAGARGRRLSAGARAGCRPLRVPDRLRVKRRRCRPSRRQLSATGLASPIWRPAAGRRRSLPAAIVALSSVVRVNGPFAGAIRRAIGDAWIADATTTPRPRAG